MSHTFNNLSCIAKLHILPYFVHTNFHCISSVHIFCRWLGSAPRFFSSFFNVCLALFYFLSVCLCFSLFFAHALSLLHTANDLQCVPHVLRKEGKESAYIRSTCSWLWIELCCFSTVTDNVSFCFNFSLTSYLPYILNNWRCVDLVLLFDDHRYSSFECCSH